MDPSPQQIYVLDRKVCLWQPANGGFRTSLDSVCLAAACPAKAGDHILDAGCGVGGAGLCVLWRIKDASLTGVEWEQSYCDLAIQNAQLNACDERASFVCCDIRTYQTDQPKPLFDHIIINPPYLEAGCHTPSPDLLRAGALGHQKDDLSLEDWIKAAHHLVKSGGSFTMIYPASGTDRILRALGKKFGAIDIIPLWPRAGVPAKRVIIRAIKDRKTPSSLHYGLVLHEANGSYTQEAEAILRSGQALC